MLLHKIINIADDFLDYISAFNKASITDYCDIEAPNSRNTFVSKDSALGTVLEIRGINKNLDHHIFATDVAGQLSDWLKPIFDKKGHALQVYYSCDPTNAKDIISKAMEPSRRATYRLGLDLEDLYESRTRALEHYVVDERIFVVMWTTPEVLSKQELQSEKRGAKKVEGRVFGVTDDSVNPFVGYKSMFSKHESFIRNIYKMFHQLGVNVDVLDINKASREIRKTVDPFSTSEDWLPILPGQMIAPSIRRKLPEKKMFDAMTPKYSWQLMPRGAKEVSDKVVVVGDQVFGSCYVDIMPSIEGDTSFNMLCDDLNGERIPWRVSFLVEGDGLSEFAFKKVFSKLLTITNKTNNLLITHGLEILEQIQLENLTAIAQARIAFATWTKTNYIFNEKSEEGILDLKQIDLQRETLLRSIKKWKNTEVVEASGDPLDCVLSSALGIKRGSIGTKMACPLNELMRVMPFNRVASPWDKGGVLFRTAEGKLIPYRPYSSLQDTFISLIWAPPGSGKSVLLNYLNTGLCMEESNVNLPYIRTIDVGKSSYGFAQLIKNSLPEDKQYLVVFERVRNIREKSINIFDTQLGCRTPLKPEETFIKNFMKLVLSEEDGTLTKGMEGLVDSLVPTMFEYYSDKRNPKYYVKDFSPLVDRALSNIGFRIDSSTTYWEVVDALFKARKIREAKIAQTYAMPILSDATSVLTQDDTLKDFYSITKDSGNENLILEFKRKMKEVLEKYPMLGDITRIDFANARIICLDLDEVVKPGEIKNNSLMYMLSRYLLARDFYVDKDEAASTPSTNLDLLAKSVPIKEYKEYHEVNFGRTREEKKRLNIDEFHLTDGSEIIRKQIANDMRLGRKYNVEIILASQLLKDFTKDMIEFTTAIYIMSDMSKEGIVESKDKFDLSDTECRILQNSLGKGERMFLGRYKMGGNYRGSAKWASFRMTATLSPEELWAYNTTTINASVRDMLYKQLGAKRTLNVLAQLYPQGVQGLLESQDLSNMTEEELKSNSERIVKDILKTATQSGMMNRSFFD